MPKDCHPTAVSYGWVKHGLNVHSTLNTQVWKLRTKGLNSVELLCLYLFLTNVSTNSFLEVLQDFDLEETEAPLRKWYLSLYVFLSILFQLWRHKFRKHNVVLTLIATQAQSTLVFFAFWTPLRGSSVYLPQISCHPDYINIMIP